MAFLIIPILEIYLFIEIGGAVGALNTILLIVLTAIIGIALMRRQGLETLAHIQREMDAGALPLDGFAHGALILAAGLLLITPGFFTDAVGFLLLWPGLRVFILLFAQNALYAYISTMHFSSRNTAKHQKQSDPRIINAAYKVEDE